MDAAAGTRIVPLEPGEVLSAAVAVYRWQWRKLWTIVAVVAIPLNIVIAVIQRLTLSSDAFGFRGGVYTTGSTTVNDIVVGVGWALTAIVCTVPLYKVVVDAYTRHPSRWRDAFRSVPSRFIPLAWLTVLEVGALAVGYAAMFVPGLYLTVAFAVSVPVLLFESTGGLGALNRSRQLVAGRWVATLAEVALGGICAGVLILAVSLVINTIDSANSIDLVLAFSALSRILSAILAFPFVAAFTTIMYIDLRGRKEHFDAHTLS